MSIIQIEYKNQENFVINERYKYVINYTTSVKFNNISSMRIDICIYETFKNIYYVEMFSGIINEPNRFLKLFGFSYEDEIEKGRKELITKACDYANKLYEGEKIIKGFKSL